MNFLQDLGKLLGKVVGTGQQTVPFDGGGHVATYAAPTPSQQANANAQIAADGAKMYMAAHPGQTYQIGQNGETYAGGVNMDLYNQLVNNPSQTGPFQPKSKPATAMPATSNLLGSAQPRITTNQPLIATGAQPQDNSPQLQIAGPDVQGAQSPGSIPLQGSNGIGLTRTFQPAYIKGFKDAGS